LPLFCHFEFMDRLQIQQAMHCMQATDGGDSDDGLVPGDIKPPPVFIRPLNTTQHHPHPGLWPSESESLPLELPLPTPVFSAPTPSLQPSFWVPVGSLAP